MRKACLRTEAHAPFLKDGLMTSATTTSATTTSATTTSPANASASIRPVPHSAASLDRNPDVLLFINDNWRPSRSGETLSVINPATEEVIGTFAHAGNDRRPG